MNNTLWLGQFLKWLFFALFIAMLLGAAAIIIVLLVDPKLPAGGLGNFNFEMAGLSANVVFQDNILAATIEHGSVRVRVENAAGVFEIIKHAGLPVALIILGFYALLFDLLRRLFRNVVRGESFSRPSVRLVQIIGFSLMIYSVVSAAAQGLFQYTLYSYLVRHATIWVSSTMVRLPQDINYTFGSESIWPLANPVFFAGLLVLALSEVFRQGLALKNENDLTV